MSGEEIYHSLCQARSLDAAVSRLSREDLAAVATHLSSLHPSGGVPAQVWGMISARLGEVRPSKRSKGGKNS